MLKTLKNIYHNRKIIQHLIDQQIKSAHRDKLLGNLWMLMDPLLTMVVLFIMFAQFRHASVVFALYLLSGLVAWDIFQKSIVGCANCLSHNKGKILKFPLPLEIFPVSIVLHKLHDIKWGLIAYCCLFAVITYFSSEPLTIPWLNILLLPVWLCFYLILSLGFGFMVASFGVYFKDTMDIVPIFLRLGFFFNPIFIPMNLISEEHHRLYFLLNPIAGYLILFRDCIPGGAPLMDNYQIPVPYYPVYLGLLTLMIFVMGFWLFNRGAKNYSKYL